MKVYHEGIIYSVECCEAFTDSKRQVHCRCVSLESADQDICFTGKDIDDIEFPPTMAEVQWLLKYGKKHMIYWIDGEEVTRDEKYPEGNNAEPREPDMMAPDRFEMAERMHNYQNLK